jgi:hypothetical protein
LSPPGENLVEPALLRCLFGHPFGALQVDPAWLIWHTGAILKLAQTVYEDREPPSGHLGAARLAVVADMLDGAGPRPHGCWAVGLIPSKDL